MEKTKLQVRMERVHCQQWYAHTFTYTYFLLFQSRIPYEKATIEMITGVGSKLLGLCMQEDGEKMMLVLDPEEVLAVKEMFGVLQEIYAAHGSAEQASMALEHLTACRLQLALAERDQRYTEPA